MVGLHRGNVGRLLAAHRQAAALTWSAGHVLAWMVPAKMCMTTPPGGKTGSCGTWSCAGTPATTVTALPAGGGRRRDDRPGRAAPALRRVRVHRRGTRHPDGGGLAARGRAGRHAGHPGAANKRLADSYPRTVRGLEPAGGGTAPRRPPGMPGAGFVLAQEFERGHDVIKLTGLDYSSTRPAIDLCRESPGTTVISGDGATGDQGSQNRPTRQRRLRATALRAVP